jgi:flagellar protein FlaG
MLIQSVANISQNLQPDGIVNSNPSSNGGAIVAAHSLISEPKSSSAIPIPQSTPVISQQPSHEQLKTAVDGMNLVMRQSNQNLEFIVDPDTKVPVIRMVDSQTGQLIRQIPSAEMIAITRAIDQFLQEHQLQHGLLLTQKA